MTLFTTTETELIPQQKIHYQISQDGTPLTYRQTIQYWQDDRPFRQHLNGILAQAPFAAYLWETPPITAAIIDRTFEFVLISAPSFARRASDTRPFQQFFTQSDTAEGVVAFSNLGGDAKMVVPSPRDDQAIYGHLADFVRHAPAEQVDMLWQVVGKTVEGQLGTRPLWVSTSGGGVAWLHVRLDSRPKYYRHRPYKNGE